MYSLYSIEAFGVTSGGLPINIFYSRWQDNTNAPAYRQSVMSTVSSSQDDYNDFRNRALRNQSGEIF